MNATKQGEGTARPGLDRLLFEEVFEQSLVEVEEGGHRGPAFQAEGAAGVGPAVGVSSACPGGSKEAQARAREGRGPGRGQADPAGPRVRQAAP